MNEQEHEELVGVLREAAALVDEGLGVLGSSVAKEHLLVYLAGDMVHDWWDSRRKKLPLGPPESTPEQREVEEREDADWEAHDRARDLTEVVLRRRAQAPDPLMVWKLYTFFLSRTRARGARARKAPPGPPP